MPVKGSRGGTGQRAQGLLPSKWTSPIWKRTDAAFVFAEELVFPEGGHAINFEGGAEAEADFVEGEAGEPFANGLERSGGDDSGAVGDGVVGKTAGE